MRVDDGTPDPPLPWVTPVARGCLVSAATLLPGGLLLVLAGVLGIIRVDAGDTLPVVIGTATVLIPVLLLGRTSARRGIAAADRIVQRDAVRVLPLRRGLWELFFVVVLATAGLLWWPDACTTMGALWALYGATFAWDLRAVRRWERRHGATLARVVRPRTGRRLRLFVLPEHVELRSAAPASLPQQV